MQNLPPLVVGKMNIRQGVGDGAFFQEARSLVEIHVRENNFFGLAVEARHIHFSCTVERLSERQELFDLIRDGQCRICISKHTAQRDSRQEVFTCQNDEHYTSGH